jgi:hypothetical protein
VPPLTDLLRPQLTVEPRPADPDTSRYVRSYLWMRVFVGALGVALPFLLVLGDRILFGGDPFPRSSLSAYYYSGVRDLLVGTLSAIGVFLITYKVADRGLDNTLSWLAGVAALTVAVFPTERPPGAPSTPLQDLLGESLVEGIHFAAAGVFIVSLAVISFFFGVREGAREPRKGRRSPAFWRRYHWSCAAAIAAALTWMVVTKLAGGPGRSLLVGETVSAWAFGASWLMKGLELDILRGKRPAGVDTEPARGID